MANTYDEKVQADILTVNQPGTPRVSWGAIFGGAVLAIGVHIMLALLGVGIGLRTIDPASDGGTGMGGLGTGTAIWSVLTILLAMAVGGWVAGRLAGVPRRLTGAIHGLIVWALGTLMLVYMASTLIGGVVGGTMSILGSVARATGQGLSAITREVSSDAQGRVDWSAIRDEAVQMLRETGDPALQPEALQQEADQAVGEAQRLAGEAEVGAALDRLFNRARAVASEVDKRDLANVLAARTGTTQQEAMERVTAWEDQYQRLQQQAAGQAGQVQQSAARNVENVTDTLGTSAIWTFVGLLMAALAAAVAGGAGAPELVELRRAEVSATS